MPPLPPDFYAQNAVDLAPQLLGCTLCRRLGDEVLRLTVTETEAYQGSEDSACHAHRGQTPRNALMYQKGGVAYVYLCYGIHHLLNVISGPAGHPQGVLLRGGVSADRRYDGPGRLTRALHITREQNGCELIGGEVLWLEQGTPLPYRTAPRVGIGYATAEDQARLWRFIAM